MAFNFELHLRSSNSELIVRRFHLRDCQLCCSDLRAKTAPSKRKGWSHELDSVQLRVEEGDPVRVKAPGIGGHKY